MDNRIDRILRMIESDCRITDEEFIDVMLNGISNFRPSDSTARKLIEKYGSLSDIVRLPFSVLSKIEGVGETGALRLCAVRQAPRLIAAENLPEVKRAVDSMEQMMNYIRPLYLNEHREVLYLLLLSDKKYVLQIEKICEGDNEGVIFDSKTIVSEALKYHARNVVLCHNHFISDSPSERDIVLNNKINTALACMNVYLLDHIIVRDSNYFSMRTHGYIAPPKINNLEDWF